MKFVDANVSGGVLPYLILYHRPSNSLVVSIRGTGSLSISLKAAKIVLQIMWSLKWHQPMTRAVSMEDLITDLLSQPVDVSEWLPPWVLEVSVANSHIITVVAKRTSLTVPLFRCLDSKISSW